MKLLGLAKSVASLKYLTMRIAPQILVCFVVLCFVGCNRHFAFRSKVKAKKSESTQQAYTNTGGSEFKLELHGRQDTSTREAVTDAVTKRGLSIEATIKPLTGLSRPTATTDKKLHKAEVDKQKNKALDGTPEEKKPNDLLFVLVCAWAVFHVLMFMTSDVFSMPLLMLIVFLYALLLVFLAKRNRKRRDQMQSKAPPSEPGGEANKGSKKPLPKPILRLRRALLICVLALVLCMTLIFAGEGIAIAVGLILCFVLSLLLLIFSLKILKLLPPGRSRFFYNLIATFSVLIIALGLILGVFALALLIAYS